MDTDFCVEKIMENTTENVRDVLSFAMDLGKSMVKCGAEINRVEEAIIRICNAYGMKQTEVFSVISMIVATTFDESNHDYTQSRRIYAYSTNLEQLEKLNALSRKVCSEKPELEKAQKELQEIITEKSKFHLSACLGFVLAASGFSVFFGGTIKDAIAAAPIAVVIYFLSTFIKARGMSKLFYTAVISAISGFLALGFVKIGFADNASMIMIGDVMLMIPGLMLVNSIREMLCGDIMSGLLRLLESVIIAAAIACGFAIPILILG